MTENLSQVTSTLITHSLGSGPPGSPSPSPGGSMELQNPQPQPRPASESVLLQDTQVICRHIMAGEAQPYKRSVVVVFFKSQRPSRLEVGSSRVG